MAKSTKCHEDSWPPPAMIHSDSAHQPRNLFGCWMKHTTLCSSLYHGVVQTSVVFSHDGDSCTHRALLFESPYVLVSERILLAVRSLHCTKLSTGKSPCLLEALLISSGFGESPLGTAQSRREGPIRIAIV